MAMPDKKSKISGKKNSKISKRKLSARDKIRNFFEANVGKKVKTQKIRQIAGISEYARRIRELRDEEGMQILSHRDRIDLKPGEYILISLNRIPSFHRNISVQLRNEILERNGFTCLRCGLTAGDPDPTNPGRKIKLHVDHIVPISQGGKNEKDNLRVLCSLCNSGKSNMQLPSETAINLLARIRKASRSVQREVFDALKKKFES